MAAACPARSGGGSALGGSAHGSTGWPGQETLTSMASMTSDTTLDTSQVLDLGRRRRLHTEAQRLALQLEQKTCTAAGCDKPPALCHAHHDTPWSAGGPTNVDTGRLLCPHHHRRIHDHHYRTTRHPNGTISFHRRQ